jgi:bone morphogenetic protein 10
MRYHFQEADDYEEETNNIWDDDFGVRSAAALHTTTTTTTPEPKIQAASKTNKNLCRRKPLYVDFAEIQYDSWVLAPTGYEVSKKSTFPTAQTNIIFHQAFQCAGRCVYPISDHLTPTKHSVIQTLVHSLSSKRAQKACCVPTKLKPISMLYLDDDGVLTYRFSYEDMVVAECGCR